ncbi:MAG: HIT family protein [Vicinamibacterales bacterium]
MDRLWSPWRLEYVARGEPGSGCIFCEATRSSESNALIVFEGSTAYIILNLYPYNNGHLMVVPYRHLATFGALSIEEVTEVAVLVQRAEAALTEAYRPHGFNVGVNVGKPAGAGVLEHLHVHIVPRWNGDTNFMTVIGDMRVLPENLGASAERLKPIFARLARP